jgi:hypothetical protein
MSNQEKYKVGDRVRILYNRSDYKCKLGVATGHDSTRSVWVTLEDGTEILWSYDNNLELYKPTANFDRNVHKDTMLAWINGSEIERYDDGCNTWWLDAEPKFETDVEYRVKRKVKVFKYKFAEMKSSYSCRPVLVLDENYATIEQGLAFISWLTDEITVEYPED